jgi:hypothetical protein
MSGKRVVAPSETEQREHAEWLERHIRALAEHAAEQRKQESQEAKPPVARE